MRYPMLQEVAQYRDMTTTFGGYNHQISCGEGQFFDMKNMTSQYFPILSPRQNRGMVKQFKNPQGILDKEDLMWIDDREFFINGKYKTKAGEEDGMRVMAKMGAYVIFMPDKVWYNTEKDEFGFMEATFDGRVKINLCEANGTPITYKDEMSVGSTPSDGEYMMSTKNGKPSLKVYSANTKTWLTVATTYVQINAKGIGNDFNKDDGVKLVTKLTIDNDNYEALSNIFVNEEEHGFRSTNTWIVNKTEDSIVIPGLIKAMVSDDLSFDLWMERKVPEMAFITECNNRLWGCSKDGHEIYCSKLGDVNNWNCFKGISTDSWAATIGSDGKFTGATTHLGYPIFFKEDGLIKVSVSATGGHQIKETKCRGVQKGSEGSLVVLNETLYYKSSTCICGYNGSLPFSISDELGEVRYTDAVGGAIGDRYYISMKDSSGSYNMFVYDTRNGIWSKEDDVQALFFCRHKDDLYFIDAKDNMMKSVRGTLLYHLPEKGTEDKFEWFAESGTIGYSSPDNKYVSRINIRITLEFGTNVDFYMQYDSSGEWEHKFNMSGKGTKTFTLPIIPRRCDHFKYKIKGKGECKIHSITKTMEDGSDI